MNRNRAAGALAATALLTVLALSGRAAGVEASSIPSASPASPEGSSSSIPDPVAGNTPPPAPAAAELLAQADDARLEMVLGNLRRASLESHLPLFEAAAAAGGTLETMSAHAP